MVVYSRCITCDDFLKVFQFPTEHGVFSLPRRLLGILAEDAFVKADVVENQIIDFASALAQPEFIDLAKY
jgi:hypothetical protein